MRLREEREGGGGGGGGAEEGQSPSVLRSQLYVSVSVSTGVYNRLKDVNCVLFLFFSPTDKATCCC